MDFTCTGIAAGLSLRLVQSTKLNQGRLVMSSKLFTLVSMVASKLGIKQQDNFLFLVL